MNTKKLFLATVGLMSLGASDLLGAGKGRNRHKVLRGTAPNAAQVEDGARKLAEEKIVPSLRRVFNVIFELIADKVNRGEIVDFAVMRDKIEGMKEYKQFNDSMVKLAGNPNAGPILQKISIDELSWYAQIAMPHVIVVILIDSRVTHKDADSIWKVFESVLFSKALGLLVGGVEVANVKAREDGLIKVATPLSGGPARLQLQYTAWPDVPFDPNRIFQCGVVDPSNPGATLEYVPVLDVDPSPAAQTQDLPTSSNCFACLRDGEPHCVCGAQSPRVGGGAPSGGVGPADDADGAQIVD